MNIIMTTTYHTQTIPNKNSIPISVWLFMQGYHASSLPLRVTWYSHDREFIGRTDHYTLNLYRGKGYVLDERFLDPMMWDHEITHDHAGCKILVKPCLIVIAPPKVPNTVPRLARELIGLLDDRDSWEGTASELLSLIGDRGDGIPRLHNRLSAELMQPYITDALDAYGITIHRERTSERRVLRLRRV
jgi:hypothetical protein